MTTPTALEVRGLTAGHDGVAVVHELDLRVEPGEVVALLGPNGAGKTTTLLTIAGLLAPMAGAVWVAGRAVGARRRAATAAAAALNRDGLLALVPEDRGLFFGLTVREHLRLARGRNGADRIDAVLDRIPELVDLLDRRAGLLSGGEQQMLAVARALVGRPRLLLVDELSLGLAPLVVQRLLPVLRDVAGDSGCGVLLVEQHVALTLAVADRALLMQRGRIALEGSAAQLAGRLSDIEAGYFGTTATTRPLERGASTESP